MLKNWKKSKVEDSTWYHKKIKYSYVNVWKTGLPLKEMKRRGHIGTYVFKGRVGYGNMTKKYFKTKTKALAYAKSYMKTH